mmetsp:Transcript_24195/g.69370  ORF Transcript_24195/g.69370 Transcript_24195/m.69370 type:complete len:259 (+) Transcript_24195:84-860(+)
MAAAGTESDSQEQRIQMQQHREVLLASPGSPNGALQQPAPAADRFFASDTGIISVFDFDYDSMIDFKKKMAWSLLLLVPPAWVSCLCCSPCFLNQNVEWQARAQHVALTIDGIRFVRDKRRSCCGLPCSDKGRESKTVPYDKITDCDVQEPAGTACCCCIQRVLSQVRVDTASSGGTTDGVPRHELVLEGLHYPHEFKQAVWSIKRGEFPIGSDVPMAPSAGRQQPLSAPAQASMTNTLLTEIRDELKELNANLKGKA